MNLAEILLEISKRDLAAAKCLYDNELYPQAIFYLQQSVEKAAKAFGLLTGIINEDELKGKYGIGHNPLKIHKIMIDKQLEKIKTVRQEFENIPELKESKLVELTDIKKMEESLIRFNSFYSEITKKDYQFLNNDAIIEFVEDLKKFDLRFQNLAITSEDIRIIEDTARKHLTEFFGHLRAYNPQKFEDLSEKLNELLNSNFIEYSLKEVTPKLLDYTYINYSLFYLSIITFPHAVSSRYPENEFNPLDAYNKEYLLIQVFEKLIEILDKTIEKIERVGENQNNKK